MRHITTSVPWHILQCPSVPLDHVNRFRTFFRKVPFLGFSRIWRGEKRSDAAIFGEVRTYNWRLPRRVTQNGHRCLPDSLRKLRTLQCAGRKRKPGACRAIISTATGYAHDDDQQPRLNQDGDLVALV